MSFLLQNHKLSKFLWSQTCWLFGLISGMSKAEVRPKALLISALMWESISPQSEELTWTLVFHNVKIVGNRDTSPCLVEYKDWSVSSITDLTNLKTNVNLGSAAKLTKKQTHYVLKPKKVNHVCMLSNALTAKETIRQTLIFVHSGNIGSTMNGTRKNILRSMKTGQNKFT